MLSVYDKVFEQLLHDPEGFWAEAAEDVHWYKKWDKVLDDSRQPFYRWFVGGSVNTCYNALDLHVENGRADQPAPRPGLTLCRGVGWSGDSEKGIALSSICPWCWKQPWRCSPVPGSG